MFKNMSLRVGSEQIVSQAHLNKDQRMDILLGGVNVEFVHVVNYWPWEINGKYTGALRSVLDGSGSDGQISQMW
jgi:hypothetical protein